MIKPYYETELGKLYHGDCLEILPQIEEKVDLVLTDPPYMNLKGNLRVDFDSGVGVNRQDSTTVGNLWQANLKWLPIAWDHAQKGMIVFSSFHALHLIPAQIKQKPLALITWYQRNSMPSQNNVPQYKTEFAWVFKKESGLMWRKLNTFYDIPRLSTGCIASPERVVDKRGKALHPTQKPTLLILYILKVGGDLVLDPFLGSGTTALACERLGRRWIGIEISKEYCDIAVKRIEEERSQLKLPLGG